MTRARGDPACARAARTVLLRVVPAALLLVLAAAPPAGAQSPVPSLFVVSATLRHADEHLFFALRFNRAVPVRELQPRRGRTVCVVLSPDARARRGGRRSRGQTACASSRRATR